MSWDQTLAQSFATLIFIIGIYLIFDRKRAQKLPEHQIPNLDIFANRAVRAVEQLYAKNPGKKDIAIGYVIDQYKEYQLPQPSKAMISMAVEASVLLLPNPGG
jgi:LL-H family phage holin